MAAVPVELITVGSHNSTPTRQLAHFNTMLYNSAKQSKLLEVLQQNAKKCSNQNSSNLAKTY